MIDLLKNYKELKNAPGYAGSLRYYLAKKKLDVSKSQYRLSSSSGCSLTNKLWNSSSKKHSQANSKRQSTSLITQRAKSTLFPSQSANQ